VFCHRSTQITILKKCSTTKDSKGHKGKTFIIKTFVPLVPIVVKGFFSVDSQINTDFTAFSSARSAKCGEKCLFELMLEVQHIATEAP
jgi:hypothetical protein